MDRLGQALHGTARSGGRVAVLYVGLDGLQPILHAHGRDAGNLLLKEAAQRLAAETRASDTLARCGGEAFLLFLQNIKTAENALLVARKHLAALGSDFALGDGHVQVSASIGIALFPEHGSSPEILVKGAEAAMARGREQGRNRIEVFTDSLHEAVSERLQLGNGLHRALDQGEFQLYYQPRIHLQRRSWAGAEALIRWNHPGLGLVMPDRFIPLAEQTGLILPLGEWVIQEACRQMWSR
jgi:diguanylate cyclase (GGDEF)-like protein